MIMPSSKKSTNEEHLLYQDYANGPALILFILTVILWTLFHGFILSVVVRDFKFLRERTEYDYYYHEIKANRATAS